MTSENIDNAYRQIVYGLITELENSIEFIIENNNMIQDNSTIEAFMKGQVIAMKKVISYLKLKIERI